MLGLLGRGWRGACMCICCVVGGVLLVILETRRRAGRNPSPGCANDIMGAFLIFVGRKDTIGIVYNVGLRSLSA
jgi:hypothetical protein